MTLVARGLNHASEIIICRSQRMLEAWFPSPSLSVFRSESLVLFELVVVVVSCTS